MFPPRTIYNFWRHPCHEVVVITVYFGPEKAGVGGVFNPHALWADRPNGRKRQGSGGAVTISTAK